MGTLRSFLVGVVVLMMVAGLAGLLEICALSERLGRAGVK